MTKNSPRAYARVRGSLHKNDETHFPWVFIAAVFRVWAVWPRCKKCGGRPPMHSNPISLVYEVIMSEVLIAFISFIYEAL